MSQSPSSFPLPEYSCPSKINLGLEVLSKRPDGYHELNTLFVRCEQPSDKIVVSASNAYRLTISDPALDAGESNLITKAVTAYSAVTGNPPPLLHLQLEKRIPMGAGLGGGSSNAAQALHIVNDYYDRPLGLASLIKIGAKIGADVPFFVSGVFAAEASGIGEQLVETNLKLPYWILIVKPESVSISTRDAYSRITPSNTQGSLLATLVSEQRWSELHNNFEEAIFPLNPQLPTIKQQLLDLGAIYASMTGSGSALFGLFGDEATAQKAAEAFAREQLPCWINPPQNQP